MKEWYKEFHFKNVLVGLDCDLRTWGLSIGYSWFYSKVFTFEILCFSLHITWRGR